MPNNYPTYLVHFNRNHDSKNGQFTYGDGDGDGRVADKLREVNKQNGVSDKDIKKIESNYKYHASRSGSQKTRDAFNEYMYEGISGANNRKNIKNFRKYNALALKDVKEARKMGDEKSANIINANRMHLAVSLADGHEYAQQYFNKAVSQLVKEHGNEIDVSKPLNFVENIEEDLGGISFDFKDYPNAKYVIKE